MTDLLALIGTCNLCEVLPRVFNDKLESMILTKMHDAAMSRMNIWDDC